MSLAALTAPRLLRPGAARGGPVRATMSPASELALRAFAAAAGGLGVLLMLLLRRGRAGGGAARALLLSTPPRRLAGSGGGLELPGLTWSGSCSSGAHATSWLWAFVMGVHCVVHGHSRMQQTPWQPPMARGREHQMKAQCGRLVSPAGLGWSWRRQRPARGSRCLLVCIQGRWGSPPRQLSLMLGWWAAAQRVVCLAGG